MSWSCGLVGLPNAGKSSLFKAITALDVTIESYPFSTIDPNKAVVAVPDQRLPEIADYASSEVVTPASIEIYDIAGLVAGASRGEGLGNRFLGQLRNTDLLIHVIGNYSGKMSFESDCLADMSVVNTELCLADLDTVGKRKEKCEGKLKGGDKKARFEYEFFTRLEKHLDTGCPARSMVFDREEQELVDQLFLLTAKQMIYVVNVDEEALSKLPDKTDLDGVPAVYLAARLEAELSEVAEEEKEDYLAAYGLQESRVSLLLSSCYELLNLVTFYTVKGQEARAWAIPVGSTAYRAAGKVHTDMQQGFINAEVINWDKLQAAGSFSLAREKGMLRTEGRDYFIRDGDIVLFRFRT